MIVWLRLSSSDVSIYVMFVIDLLSDELLLKRSLKYEFNSSYYALSNQKVKINTYLDKMRNSIITHG